MRATFTALLPSRNGSTDQLHPAAAVHPGYEGALLRGESRASLAPFLAVYLGGRRATANAHNLLEVATLLVINKAARKVSETLPNPAGPLRFDKCAPQMADVFKVRW